MQIHGVNPVIEALRAGRVTRLRVAPRVDRRIEEVVALARRSGVPIEHVDAPTLDRMVRGAVHQGVVAEVPAPRDHTIEELVNAGGTPLLVVLDGIEDPQNVGAILRSADAAGATGVVRQARHAAPLDGSVGKASAGALAHVKIATVVNVARAIEELKALGVRSVGLAADGTDAYTAVDLRLPTAVVVGAEGTGLRRLVRERCDRIARIPMAGAVGSLNVSVAAGIVLFEAVRQRTAGAAG